MAIPLSNTPGFGLSIFNQPQPPALSTTPAAPATPESLEGTIAPLPVPGVPTLPRARALPAPEPGGLAEFSSLLRDFGAAAQAQRPKGIDFLSRFHDAGLAMSPKAATLLLQQDAERVGRGARQAFAEINEYLKEIKRQDEIKMVREQKEKDSLLTLITQNPLAAKNAGITFADSLDTAVVKMQPFLAAEAEAENVLKIAKAKADIAYQEALTEAKERTRFSSTGGGGGRRTPTVKPITFNNEDRKLLKGLGAEGFSTDLKNQLVTILTKKEAKDFIAYWKDEQNRRGMSFVPTMDFLMEWGAKRDQESLDAGNLFSEE